jgi:hypothetical protein
MSVHRTTRSSLLPEFYPVAMSCSFHNLLSPIVNAITAFLVDPMNYDTACPLDEENLMKCYLYMS